jgi:hypothetical protein
MFKTPMAPSRNSSRTMRTRGFALTLAPLAPALGALSAWGVG